jgi:hypothetical protein
LFSFSLFGFIYFLFSVVYFHSICISCVISCLPNLCCNLLWAGHVARIGEKRNAYRSLVGKLEGKRPLGRPRCRWVDNIRMDLGEVDWGDVDWIGLAKDRNRWRALVNSVLNLRVP